MTTPNRADRLPEDENLPWLSMNAAIELDNLRLERQETFEKVAALARRLRTEMEDFLQTILLWESLDAVIPNRREAVQTTDQLAVEIATMSDRLAAVAAAPHEADPTEVNALRDYATNLSRLAMAKESERRRPYRALAA